MLDNGFTMEEVVKAGYFEDNFHDREIMKTDCERDKEIVLALSGCFSPFHAGHMGALVQAKFYFKKLGYSKVRGILFPAHDSYVSTKRNGEVKCDIDTRLAQIRDFLNTFDTERWIMIDKFPAKSLPNEVNFPFLVDRLQAIANWYNPSADTAFVIGGDNSHFAYAFSGSKTKVICVDRSNSIALDKSRLIDVDYHEIKDNPYHDLSSSKIRQTVLCSQG